MKNKAWLFFCIYFWLGGIVLFNLSSCQLISKNQKVPQAKTIDKESIKATANFIEAKKNVITGNFPEAKKLFHSHIIEYPNDHAAYYELADIYRQENDFTKAVKHIEKAVRLDPTNLWYKLLLTDIDIQNGNNKRAIKTLESLYDQSGNKIYLEQLALVYESTNEISSALKIYDRIEKEFGPNESVGMIKYDLLQNAGNDNAALKEIEKLSVHFPNQIKYKTLLAENYLRQRRAVDAKNMIDASLNIDANDHASQFLLAEYYNLVGQTNRAFTAMEKVFLSSDIEIDPKIGVLLNLFQNPSNPQNDQHISRLLNAVVIAHPEDPKAWSMKADYRFRDKRYEEARKAFRKVIVLDSLKFDVWEQLLICNHYLKDNISLENEASRAIEIFPEQATLYLFQAIGLKNQKRDEEALKAIKRGLYFASPNSKTGRALNEIKKEIQQI